MTLEQYLRQERISQAWFAKQVGTTEATISRIRRKLVMPKLDLAIRIVEESQDQITLKELLAEN